MKLDNGLEVISWVSNHVFFDDGCEQDLRSSRVSDEGVRIAHQHGLDDDKTHRKERRKHLLVINRGLLTFPCLRGGGLKIPCSVCGKEYVVTAEHYRQIVSY